MKYIPSSYPFFSKKINKQKLFKNFGWFNSARASLKFLLQQIVKNRSDTVCLIPAYTCPTVLHAIKEVNIKYDFVDIDNSLDFNIQKLNEKIDFYKLKNIILIPTSLFGINLRDYKSIFPNIVVIEDRAQAMFNKNSTANYQILSFGKGKIISSWSGGAIYPLDDNLHKEYLKLKEEKSFLLDYTKSILLTIIAKYFWYFIEKSPLNPEKKSKMDFVPIETLRLSTKKIEWLSTSITSYNISKRVSISNSYLQKIDSSLLFDLDQNIAYHRFPIKCDLNLTGVSQLLPFREVLKEAQTLNKDEFTGANELAKASLLPVHQLVNKRHIDSIVEILNNIDNSLEIYLDELNNNNKANIFNDKIFIDIISKIYKIEPLFQKINNLNTMLSFKVNNLFSGKKIISMPYSFYPLIFNNLSDKEVMLKMIDSAKKLGNNYYVEYKSIGNSNLKEEIKNQSIHKIHTGINSLLLLKNEYTIQYQRYSKKLRQNIRTTRRRAEEKNIKFVLAESENDIEKFYNMLNFMFKSKHKTISQPFEIFRDIFLTLKPQGKADFFLAKLNKKVLAGIVILKYNNNWTYMWGASNYDYDKLGLNTLLVDMAIQDAINAKAKSFDFGPSAINNTHLINFKTKWGCEQTDLFTYYWNKKPNENSIDESFSIARNIFSKMPLFITKQIPKFIAPIMV